MDLLKILLIIFLSMIWMNAIGKEINFASVSHGYHGYEMGYEDWSKILSIDWTVEDGPECEVQTIANKSSYREVTKTIKFDTSLCEHCCYGPSSEATLRSQCSRCNTINDQELDKDGEGVWPTWKTKRHEDSTSEWPSTQTCTFTGHNDPDNWSLNKTCASYKLKVSRQRTYALGNLLTSNQLLRRRARDMQLAKEMEQVEKKLSQMDKWHFMVGYTDLAALREAELLIKSRVQHVSTKENIKYFLTFIPKHLAQKMRANPKFVVVKPLVGNLKIEGFNLGTKLRKLNRRHEKAFLQRDVSLKANLAKDELSIQEARDLSASWEYSFKTNNWHMCSKERCAKHMNQNCEPSLSESKKASIQRYAMRVKCVAPDETAIICHFIHNQILQYIVEFMAREALVQLVEVKPSYQIFNHWSKSLLQSVSRGYTPIYDAGIRGEGEIIAHADTGIDMKHCFFFDEDRPIPYNYIDYNARKVIQYKALEGGDFFDMPMGHGTHVAGSIAGDTKVGGDSFSGMAPAAKITFFDMGTGPHELVNVPNNLGKGLFAYGYFAGARIFCNSWGDRLQGYGSGPHDVDSFSYEHQDVLILFAAGNDGDRGTNTIASPATSKNCIAVGASLNVMDSFQSILPSNELLPFEFLSTVAPFSSVGPTSDGRTKPDILAPGMEIWSSISQGGNHGQSCQVLPNQGTSCATPLIAGAAALARQYFREGYYPLGFKNSNNSFTPTGALLKAILIHSGVHMDAYFSPVRLEKITNQPPNSMEGYGRVVLERVLLFSPPLKGVKKLPSRLLVRSGAYHGAILEHGEKHVLLIHVLSDSEALQATMVWMDPPAAAGSSNPMINNLDLLVIGHQVSYFPNGKFSRDSTNNVEAVSVAKPIPGAWEVEVKASTIVSKKQPYALVLTGHFVLLDDRVVSSAHKRCCSPLFGFIGFFNYPFLFIFLASWLLK